MLTQQEGQMEDAQEALSEAVRLAPESEAAAPRDGAVLS